MDERDIYRVFDQTRPSPAQKQAMLDRLLEPERKVRPMKKLKKLTVVAVAAVLMVITCAAAVVTGIDQRIMDYLNAEPAQEELISPYAVPVNATMRDSGGTLQIKQMLVDRYTVMMLMDFTAPKGVDLSQAEGFAWWTEAGQGWYVNLCDYLDSDGNELELGTRHAEWICLETDTEKQRATFLYCEHLAEGGTDEADSIRFAASALRNEDGQPLLFGNWSCVLSIPADSGWEVTMDEAYWTEGTEERVTEVYLSPMTFHVTLNRDVPVDGDMDWFIWRENFAWFQQNIILTDQNGKTIAYYDKRCIGNPQTTTLTFGFEELMDPAQFQGGRLTINGVDISLDNLTSMG